MKIPIFDSVAKVVVIRPDNPGAGSSGTFTFPFSGRVELAMRLAILIGEEFAGHPDSEHTKFQFILSIK